jgi:hypothetical protein
MNRLFLFALLILLELLHHVREGQDWRREAHIANFVKQID